MPLALVVPVGGPSPASATILSQLPDQPDISNQAYGNIASDDGAPVTVTVPSGYSLPLIMSALAPTASFAFAEIEPLNGAVLPPVLLTHAQATSKTAFPDGSAVIWGDSNDESHFLAPSTGSGTTNEGETFETGGTVAIYLHSGSILSVAISVSKQAVTTGTPVHFATTSVTGAASGTTLSYTWIFGDGTGATQVSADHSYLVSGTYDAYLKVTGSDDSLGFSAVYPITVGKAPKGPNRNGGGTSKRRKAPTSGAGVQGSQNKKKSASAARSAGPPTTATPTDTKTTTTNGAVRSAPHSHQAVEWPHQLLGPLLAGIVVDGADLELAARAHSTAARRAGVVDPARTGHLRALARGRSEGLWIVLGVLAMLSIGALLEWIGVPAIVPRIPLVH